MSARRSTRATGRRAACVAHVRIGVVAVVVLVLGAGMGVGAAWARPRTTPHGVPSPLAGDEEYLAWHARFASAYTAHDAMGEGLHGPMGARRALRARTLSEKQAELRTFVESLMACGHIAGMGVSVVSGDAELFVGGLGTRSARHGGAVDEHTLFSIGSTTKGFTALLLGLLRDEGLVQFSDRVASHVPGFRLQDAHAVPTLRDLMVHRTGVPRHDNVWTTGACAGRTRLDLVQRLQYVAPFDTFRETFKYSNLMWLAAGVVAEQVNREGHTWEELIQERVFDVLGMDDSTPTYAQSLGRANRASPHAKSGAEMAANSNENIDFIGPAGSIYSTPRDVGRYLQMYLNHGKHNGTQFASLSSLREIFTGHMQCPEMMHLARPLFPAPISSPTYGYGWFVEQYRGYRRLVHNGATNGYSAFMSFLPELGLGVGLQCNMEAAGCNLLMQLISYYAIDVFADLDPWLDAQSACYFPCTFTCQPAICADTPMCKARARGDAAEESFADVLHSGGVVGVGVGDAPPTDAVVGEYSHPTYGTLRFFTNDDDDSTLRFAWGSMKNTSCTWLGENFFQCDGMIGGSVGSIVPHFHLNFHGKYDACEVPLEPLTGPILFTNAHYDAPTYGFSQDTGPQFVYRDTVTHEEHSERSEHAVTAVAAVLGTLLAVSVATLAFVAVRGRAGATTSKSEHYVEFSGEGGS